MSVYSTTLRECTQVSTTLNHILTEIEYRNKGKVRGTILKRDDIDKLNSTNVILKHVINKLLPDLEKYNIELEKEVSMNRGRIDVFVQVNAKYLGLLERCYNDYKSNHKIDIANYLMNETNQIETVKLKELTNNLSL